MTDKVFIFKLTNGEELVAEVSKSAGLQYELNKPRIMMIGQDAKGQLSVQLIPWFFGNPDATNVPLSAHAIAGGPIAAPKQLHDAYLQNTTGIALASKVLTEKK